ncbi:MAG: hypothetical protein JO007_14550 [Alphaproteobacteria bacterium]|nr:hypothetical protein [Alphaproteobacteria bacterium]
MRNLAISVVLMLGITIPHFAWADPTGGQSPWIRSGTTAQHSLQNLFGSLGLGLITKAYAAECESEGEICKTNADCCSGLECSGDPQPTCRIPE